MSLFHVHSSFPQKGCEAAGGTLGIPGTLPGGQGLTAWAEWALRAFPLLPRGEGSSWVQHSSKAGEVASGARKGRPRGGLTLWVTAAGPAPSPCIQSCLKGHPQAELGAASDSGQHPSVVCKPQSRHSAMPMAAKQQRCSFPAILRR